jgi:general secretion pathway protein G
MNVATRTDHRSEGFTLIEIMAVVLIIGMLSGIVGFAVFQQVDKARVVTARAQIDRLESSLELYSMDNGHFPSTEQGLDALIHEPTGAPEPTNYQSGGYLRGGELPKDPWGFDFQYESPGANNNDSFDLWSFGKDGTAGGEDLNADIGNWSDENSG